MDANRLVSYGTIDLSTRVRDILARPAVEVFMGALLLLVFPLAGRDRICDHFPIIYLSSRAPDNDNDDEEDEHHDEDDEGRQSKRANWCQFELVARDKRRKQSANLATQVDTTQCLTRSPP